MTQTLPDTLRKLSQLMPGGRIRVQSDREYGVGPYETVYVVSDGSLQRLCRLTPEKFSDLTGHTLVFLEYALREEIAARGWRWQVTSDSDNGLFGSEIAVQLAPQGRASYFYAGEPTPAQSLAACLLSALEAAQAAAVAADRQAHPESKFDEVGFEESPA